MKDELDMIFSKKESDIEKISSRYKAVDDKRKEKIYEISKRKYNIIKAGESETSDDGFIVSAEGVERYSRPKLYRYFFRGSGSFGTIWRSIRRRNAFPFLKGSAHELEQQYRRNGGNFRRRDKS